MNKNALAIASSALLLFAAVAASAQETPGAKPPTTGAAVPKPLNVTQDQLVKAGADPRNWLHTQGNYSQSGGANNADSLYVAYNPNSRGAYLLKGVPGEWPIFAAQ